jgi:hypothetical protein
MKKDKEPLFHLEFVTEEDQKKKDAETISNLKEEQKSEFVFEGESLYLDYSGHAFLNGFFNSYITKSSIRATQYLSGFWNINGDGYNYEDGKFIKIEYPEQPSEPIDFNNISFPIVKNVVAKLISDDLVSETPKHD